MSIDLTEYNPEPFFYWINERHSIYLKKEAGLPWPWTSDKILQDYSFCNVFRELDKVTIAFKKMIREPYYDHPNLWFLYCLARQINWPHTISDILRSSSLPDVWEPHEVYSILNERRLHGLKIYTGAYKIGGSISTEIRNELPDSIIGNDKLAYTVYQVLDPVFKLNRFGKKSKCSFEEFVNGTFPTDYSLDGSIQEFVEWLSQFHGWGGFLSYEVASDLRHTRYLINAPDIMTWANPGPGAKRGLNRVFGRYLEQSCPNALDEMRFLLSESPKYIESHVPALEMRDIEHSLCECDKYLRVKNGEGRPRSKYKYVMPDLQVR